MLPAIFCLSLPVTLTVGTSLSVARVSVHPVTSPACLFICRQVFVGIASATTDQPQVTVTGAGPDA